ncbi:hypothetical protein [Actinomycetospora lemnae]|uniref:Membrane-associated oxidoreductase n=1 Tax=Actinomycetospora lemnae TaxID=3019891 RepID=A0ABT5SRT3_9PSEU|nr:hypothetical protein [Actinomycetospora sp. DW7H6]MDD7965499.1 hypothetical protein [Actinomycetospora sp. DW7H6]
MSNDPYDVCRPRSVRDRLVTQLIAGEWLNLVPDYEWHVPVGEAAMREWGRDHDLDAEDLRALLLGRGLPDQETVDPRGVQLRGARIVGRLDLDQLSATVPLTLVDCRLDEGVTAQAAHLPHLALHRCCVSTIYSSALNAAGIRLDDDLHLTSSVLTTTATDTFAVSLAGARIEGDFNCSGSKLVNESGAALVADRAEITGEVSFSGGFSALGAGMASAVRLRGARITGELWCREAELVNESGPALDATGVHVGRDVVLAAELIARGSGENGAVLLNPANIVGSLVCAGAQLVNKSGPALSADGVQVGGDVFLTTEFSASGASKRPAVGLSRARIGGALVCDRAELVNDSGPALTAPLSRVGSAVLLSKEFRAHGSGKDGAVGLTGAHIIEMLSCEGVELVNECGPAISAPGLQVGSDVILLGFTAHGSGENGAVRLPGANIAGQLNCQDAELVNDSGPALLADGIQVTRDVILQGVRARGVGENGAVRLSGARITGQLNCRSAEVVNDSGPALTADGLKVSQLVAMDCGFTARGSGEKGAVRLLGAHIDGQLICRGAELVNDSGPALTADGLQVSREVALDSGFSAHGSGQDGAVRLLSAHITGQLNCQGAEMVNKSGPALVADGIHVSGGSILDGGFPGHGGCGAVISLRGAKLETLRLDGSTESTEQWNLDGATYTGIPRPDDVRWWLTLLGSRTPGYAAQPYQQLAAAYRAAGHDRDVRDILIAQRRDQIHRGRLSWSEKAWATFTGWMLGYGWKPWRALYGLIAVFVLSAVLSTVLGHVGALIRPPLPGVAHQSCSVLERVGAGLDLGTPLFGSTTKPRDRCVINPDAGSASATTLVISTWVLQLAAWGFAALFIAGFTGAVRKT